MGQYLSIQIWKNQSRFVHSLFVQSWLNSLIGPKVRRIKEGEIEYEIYCQTKGKVLKDLISKTITGKQLKEIIGDMPLLKFMNNDDTHYGLKYHQGINKDNNHPFINNGACSPGGIYVTTLENAYEYWDKFGNYARRVHIEDDALIYVEKNKIKCNKIILDERKLKNELMKELFLNSTPEVIKKAVKRNYNVIQFIDEDKMTPEINLEVIKQACHLIKWLDKDQRTSEIILEAVRQDPDLIQFIDKEQRTPEILLELVERNAFLIKMIDKDQRTNEIILAAIRSSFGTIIKYIDQDQITDEMKSIVKSYSSMKFELQ